MEKNQQKKQEEIVKEQELILFKQEQCPNCKSFRLQLISTQQYESFCRLNLICLSCGLSLLMDIDGGISYELSEKNQDKNKPSYLG